MTNGTVTTSGSGAFGIRAYSSSTSGSGSATATISDGSISTTNAGSDGLNALGNGSGAAQASVNGGTVTTQGNSAHGAYSLILNSSAGGSASTNMTDGAVETSGSSAIGLYAENKGSGDANTSISGGNITTTGTSSYGLFSLIDNSTSLPQATATIAGGTISTSGSTAYGVFARTDGLGDAVIAINGGNIITSGASGRGALAFINNSSSTAQTSITMTAGSIQTSGDDAYGLRASNSGTGDAEITVSGGSITTTGVDGSALFSTITNATSTGTSTISLSGGTISTSADSAFGLLARTDGLGAASINISGGDITTAGEDARGASAYISNTSSTSDASITMSDGSIQTSGLYGYGLRSSNDGLGSATTSQSGGSISTQQADTFGHYSVIGNASSLAQKSSSLSGGSVSTAGSGAYGLYSSNQGLGNTTLTFTDSSITTTGTSAHGLRGTIDNTLSSATLSADMSGGSITAAGSTSDGQFLWNKGSGTTSVTIGSSASITSGSDQASGIHTVGSGGGTISIASGATINSSASGIAIRDGDSDFDGNDELASAGNITVDTSGTVTGDAILGFGNDSFTLRGGVYTGDIYGDDVTASANDGNDSFAWLGGALNSGFYGGNGSDTASIDANAIYDGTEVMDGGDDVSSTDGWIDNLTILGQTATIAPDTWLNWENITLDSSTLTYQGNDLTVGSETGYGLTLTNGARLSVTSGFALTGNLVLANGTVLETTGTDAGTFAIIGDVQNNGTLSLADGGVGDQLTITGNVAGPGIVIVDVDTSNGTADTLRVNGDASGATTSVQVNNLTPSTASGVDIPVIMIESGLPFASYSLMGGSFIAGAYTYELEEVGSNAVLVASFNSNGQTYQIAPLVLASAFTSLPTLKKRTAGRKTLGNQQALWTRVSTERLNAISASGSSFESTVSWYRGGADYRWDGFTPGHWVFGANVGYGTLNSRLSDTNRFGSLSASGLAAGATATWFGERGTYVDLQSQAVWMQTSAASTDSGRLKEDLPATALAASLEIGQEVSFANRWKAIPQAQLKWGQVSASQFFDNTGSRVDIGHNDSLIGRAGLAIHYDQKATGDELGISAHLIGNILHEFKPESDVSVGGQTLSDEIDQTWAEVGFGADINWGHRFALFGELAYRQSLTGSASDNHGLSASGGVRYNW